MSTQDKTSQKNAGIYPFPVFWIRTSILAFKRPKTVLNLDLTATVIAILSLLKSSMEQYTETIYFNEPVSAAIIGHQMQHCYSRVHYVAL